MQIEVDLLDEVVLLVDGQYQVRDAFIAKGITRHECPYPVTHYTYRKLLTPAGYCCVCGYQPDQLEEPCSASGGFHAFVGAEEDPYIPDQHKVSARSLAVHRITYDEFDFYIEPDNLFPIEGISTPLEV